MDQILSILFYQPIVNLLLLLYKGLFENLPIAVIALTVLIKLILWPLYKKQLHGQERIKKLQPQLKELQSKKKKPHEYTEVEKQLIAEQSRAMGAGCLPLLIQLPFFFAIYAVIGNIIGNNANKISELAYFNFLKFPQDYHYHTSFLGIDFAAIPAQVGFGNFVQLLPFLAIIAVVVITQWYSTKLITPAMNEKKDEKNDKQSKKPLKKVEEKKPQEPNPEELQKMISQQTLYILPVILAVMSWSFAAILSLYIITTNIFTIVQTLIVNNKVKLPWKQQISEKK